jgi:peroxiredoxin
VVSFAEPAKLFQYQEYHNWPFAILADPNRVAYKAFALKRLSRLSVFSPATLWQYLQLLRKGQRLRHYGDEDIYQGGGDFLIDREGNILFAHRSQDPADRPPLEKLLKAIDRILSTSISKEIQS